MSKRPIETIMGIVVLAIAMFFGYFAYKVSDLQVVKGYNVTAKFVKVGGLNVGSDVRINGIKVGTVIAQNLDQNDYEAEVTLSLSNELKIPTDSVVSIVGDGLMGAKFVKIDPGQSTEYLRDGDVINKTKEFKTIEDMVGEIIFMVTGDDKN